MLQDPAKKLTLERAWLCIAVNQFATPGMGSIMARRRIAGTGQLGLALAGFLLLVIWMAQFFHRRLMIALDAPEPPAAAGWLWRWGLICLGAGWLWALVTSLLILREAKAKAGMAPSQTVLDSESTGSASEPESGDSA